MQYYYITNDLKYFYAVAKCVERGLDPLTTNLVVIVYHLYPVL